MNPRPTASDEVRSKRTGDEDDASGPAPVTPSSSKPASSRAAQLSTPSTVPPGYYLG
jgi:hypothetical protein